MKNMFLVVIVVALVSCLIMTGCAQPAPSPTPTPVPEPSKTLDIGLATPLTGPAAFLGTQSKEGILFAMEEQNKEGGVTIAGQKYTLNAVTLDTKNDRVVGKTVAEELVFTNNVKVIMGAAIADAIGIQAVTEPNKVIMFGMMAVTPSMTGPNKIYSFYSSRPALQMYQGGLAYIQKFYPATKTAMSFVVDAGDTPVFMDAAKTMYAKYGFNWLGYEKFGSDIKDFAPVIARVLSKNPDMVDTASVGGSMGGKCALLVKQLREVGFNGLILLPASPPSGTMTDTVPKQSLTKVISRDMDPNSPIMPATYRDVWAKAHEEFNDIPTDAFFNRYDPVRAFFAFLNGQDTMDTTAWVQKFEKYHWKSIFGTDGVWIGQPIWGINRFVVGSPIVSEYTDGTLETKWSAPIPMEMYLQK